MKLIALTLFTVLSLGSGLRAADGGWIRIFNGKDLSGWKSNEAGEGKAGVFTIGKERGQSRTTAHSHGVERKGVSPAQPHIHTALNASCHELTRTGTTPQWPVQALEERT